MGSKGKYFTQSIATYQSPQQKRLEGLRRDVLDEIRFRQQAAKQSKYYALNQYLAQVNEVCEQRLPEITKGEKNSQFRNN